MHLCDDVECIERATLAAVPPDACEELPGWLLALDRGTVGRAHSAVPLTHDAPDLAVLERIEAVYAAHGLRAVLRLPCVPAFDALRVRLAAGGAQVSKPTLVQVGSSRAMAAMGDDHGVVLSDVADEAWASVFLGEGFDPVDGASRVRLLSRSRSAAYASVRRDGRTVAVGAACFSHGWVSVHGMRTLPAFRGMGAASSILAAVGHAALARGIERAFLQVEAVNQTAQSLYRRAGFQTAWAYEYWTLGDATVGAP